MDTLTMIQTAIRKGITQESIIKVLDMYRPEWDKPTAFDKDWDGIALASEPVWLAFGNKQCCVLCGAEKPNARN